MTALDHRTQTGPAAPSAAGVATRVAEAFLNLARAIRNRRHISHLDELSDHQLADLGLTRSDLVIAMHAPLNTDPTARLSTLARERYWTEFGARRVC